MVRLDCIQRKRPFATDSSRVERFFSVKGGKTAISPGKARNTRKKSLCYDAYWCQDGKNTAVSTVLDVRIEPRRLRVELAIANFWHLYTLTILYIDSLLKPLNRKKASFGRHEKSAVEHLIF